MTLDFARQEAERRTRELGTTHHVFQSVNGVDYFVSDRVYRGYTPVHTSQAASVSDSPDETVRPRMERLCELNANPADNTREELTQKYGQVWDTNQLSADYNVEGFMAPYVVARRKADGVRGSLEFCHSPRFYFNFVVDEGRP